MKRYNHITYIVPGYNFVDNVPNLIQGFKEQKNQDFDVRIIDDMSTDGTWEAIEPLDTRPVDGQYLTYCFKNTEKKFALRNIVETALCMNDEEIIAVVDADDCLCNPDATDLILGAYNDGADVVWTAHQWDVNPSMNVSKALPEKVDPYQYPWCASHLRTFKVSELKKLNLDNFKDTDGNWFQRGYDQVLMLPLLRQAEDRRYVDEVCYLYKIDSCSIPKEQRNYAEVRQLSTVSLVRARGFVE